MTCLGSPATGIRLTRSRRTWGPLLQQWMHVRLPATKKGRTPSGKKKQSRKKTTPRRKMTTLATIAAANPIIQKRSAQQMARTVINVEKPATLAMCAKAIHPEEVEVEAVVVRDPEVEATISRNQVPNRTHSQQSKQSQSR